VINEIKTDTVVNEELNLGKYGNDQPIISIGPTNSYLYSRLSYDRAMDFVPVTSLGIIHQALVVHPSFPGPERLESD